MKNNLCLIILFGLVLSACQSTKIALTKLPNQQTSTTLVLAPTEIEKTLSPANATSLPTKATFMTVTSSPTFLPKPLPTGTQTPAFAIDLVRFDPDIYPPILVSHNPPKIAKADEEVRLEFNFVCAYMFELPDISCNPKATLFVSYGEDDEFTSVPLQKEMQDEGEFWVARLPATNDDGKPFQYYLQVNDPQVGLRVRYPVEGKIDLFAVPSFIPIDLPDQKPVETSKLVLAMPRGSGPEEIGIQKREGYPLKEGPSAIDVADDGRIALLDPVNERVLVYDPINQSFARISLPFIYKSQGDLQFDREGQLAIFDKVGESIEQSTVSVPHLYRMYLDGSIDAVAPVFVTFPSMLTKDIEILDTYDGRLVKPFSPTGEVNSREAQRRKHNPALLFRFVENLDPYVARFGDVEADLAFEINSISPLGAITYFEKTPQGYIAVFHADQIRAVYFDSSGDVLKDVTLRNNQYSEVPFLGQVAFDKSGSLYVLGSTERGIEVRFVEVP